MCEADSRKRHSELPGTEGRVLYLHTGFPKTGTTALQKFFASNKLALGDLGVWYLQAGRLRQDESWGKFRWLKKMFAKAARRHLADQHHPLFGPITKGSRIRPWSWDRSLELLRKEVESSSFSQFLCSTELLNQGIDFSELPRLYDIFDHIKAVVYVRRQDGFMASLYEQAVKSHGLSQPFDYSRRLALAPDYHNALSQWSSFVEGRGEVIVCPYEKQQFHGGDIYSDFFYRVFHVELDVSQCKAPSSNPNPRLVRDALEFKRLLNICCGRQEASRFLGALFDYSAKRAPETAMPFTMRSLLSPEQKLGACIHFEASNAKVARQYLGREDGRLFYEKLPESDAPCELYHGLTGETAGDIIDFLKKEQPSLIDPLCDSLQSPPGNTPSEDVKYLCMIRDIIGR
ncbi:MAG: hypothetical protein HN350_08345 [Phycisphaerales bacterium]|jgi:hypothetical protein|nr:hypothetical protein [Phycisphaerales bacterium]